jgi:hypothetical protein
MVTKTYDVVGVDADADVVSLFPFVAAGVVPDVAAAEDPAAGEAAVVPAATEDPDAPTQALLTVPT